MKKYFILILSVIMLMCFGSCGGKGEHSDGSNSIEEVETQGNIAVIYFSATNNTKNVAIKIAEASCGTLIEIRPKVPYTQADLNYNDNNSRANKEQNDPAARPEIENQIDVTTYDTIFLGYPIWWGTIPKIINTFCDMYDLSGKTVIPFCTSGSTGISASENALHILQPAATWKQGRRWKTNPSGSEISNWIKSLGV